ncbi:MAG: acetylglutamate kinase [Verrucomicrobiota bacterium]|nr:acetylglutamate kinase [Verrucomicrobiota bacterium]
MKKIIEKASVLMEALPYIQEFRDSVILIKFGGSSMENEAMISGVLKDIVLLECVGMKPVIIHGGGKAINKKLAKMGIRTHFIDGLRYTCKDTIEVVDDVLHNEVNVGLVNSMNKMGGKAKTLSGKNIISAKKLEKTAGNKKIDYGYVGEVADVDCNLIYEDIKKGFIPIITPLGKGENQETFNINADLVACSLAERLEPRKLVFISNIPGLLQDPKDETSLISTIKVDEVENYIDNEIIHGGMIPKIRAMVTAIKAGLEKVHLIDGRLQHSLLLEIFTDHGIGTEIMM